MASASVLVPLYQYPTTPETWGPLYDAIDQHPNVRFLIIVNPNSGPGDTLTPDTNYTYEIPRLNSRANVQTLGYVSTDYCRRDVADVVREVGVYSGWSRIAAEGVYVQGIFFDETPNNWSAEAADYLSLMTTEVKIDTGIRGNRLVMHNPGTIPDPNLAHEKSDITAIFEASYASYQSEWTQARLDAHHYDRASSSFIVHSTPTEEIGNLVKKLRLRAEYLFVTDLQDNYYESFGAGWTTFIDAVAADPALA